MKSAADPAPMTDEFTQYLANKRTLVEAHLAESLRSAGACPPSLIEAMRYGLMAPGKRLRPVLVIMAAEASGGSDLQAMPAACAVEMIHAYSLIHDDLPAMDDDDLRRGQPTCHKQFGEALAILAGDGLLTLPFQVLAEGLPRTTAALACAELARGAGSSGMVGGQVEDLAWENCNRRPDQPAKLENLETVHARKTGALFRSCLRLGILTVQGELPGGPDPALLDCLDSYGKCFGQAFQIVDDLLDVQGTVEETGKRVQKDARRGKLTYPALLGLVESRERAENLCRQAKCHLKPLGAGGQRLVALVDFVLARNR